VIVRHLVAQARAFNAHAVAHGCTGKGNDQVRFEVGTHALAPDLEVLAPARNWGMTRADSVDFAEKWEIPIKATKEKIYSIDENLWGRAIECGAIEDPWAAPPEEPYTFTRVTNREPVELTVSFAEGVPVALDGVNLKLADLIQILTLEPARPVLDASTWWRTEGSASRVARSTSVRAPSLSSRPTRFRGPRARTRRPSRKGPPGDALVRVGLRRHVVLAAERGAGRVHRRDPATREWGRASALRGPGPTADRLDARSPKALYDYGLATYDAADTFRHADSEGYVRIYGLGVKTWAQRQGAKHATPPTP